MNPRLIFISHLQFVPLQSREGAQFCVELGELRFIVGKVDLRSLSASLGGLYLFIYLLWMMAVFV